MSKARGAIRRAGNLHSFKSAYNRGQRIASALALFSMLWFTAQPGALAGTPITLNNTTGLGIEPAPASAPGANGSGFYTTWYNDNVLGTSGGYLGGFNFFNRAPGAVTIDQVINQTGQNGTQDYTNAAFRPPNIGQNNLGILWTGVLKITTGGVYNFETRSDDGSFVYVDGVQVVDNDFAQGITGRNGNITLTAGFHNIVVKLGQGGGGVGNEFNYTGADTGNAKVLVGSVAGTVTNTGSRTTGAFVATNYDISITAGTTAKISASQGIGTTTNTGTMTFGANANVTYLGGVIGSETGIVQSGAVTLNGNNTINVGSNITAGGELIRGFGTALPVTISGNIGEGTPGSVLTLNAPFGLTLSGNNTYSGGTTVTGGNVFLNAATGTALGTGNLTINAVGSTSPNVTLLKSNQIGNNAIITMTAGVLDLGAFDQTVNRVILNGQQIRGNGGTLTITDWTANNLESGLISARLKNLNGQSDQILKSTGGTLTLAGDNSQYNGLITVNSGTLVAAANHALGADANPAQEFDRLISFSNDGQLQLRGNINLGFQNLIFTGGNNQAINNLSGTNTFGGGSLTLVDGANITSSAGNLVFGAGVQFQAGNLELRGAGDFTFNNNIFTQTATNSVGSLTMKGTGTLIFGSPQKADFQSKFTLESGNVGFSGPQDFGSLSVPTGKAYLFQTDPGPGITGGPIRLTATAGSSIVAGFTPTPAFVGRITPASVGTLVLTKDESVDINLSNTGMGLGATRPLTYSGTLTPGTNGYQLGAGAGALTMTKPLTGNNAVGINGAVRLATTNTFVGDMTINAGARLSGVFTDDTFGGSVNNKVILNGGTLELNNVTSGNWNTTFLQLGSPNPDLNLGAGRRIVIGGNGGTIDVAAFSDLWNNAYLTGLNQLQGTGQLTKTGLGSLWVANAQNFGGSLVMANNGGRIDVRNAGTLTGLTSITLNERSLLAISNNGGIQNGRTFLSPNLTDRIGDTTPIAMSGGRLTYEANNQAGSTTFETFGAVTLLTGMNEIMSFRSGNNGSNMVLSDLRNRQNLANTVGQPTSIGATLRIQAQDFGSPQNNELGGGGDSSRIFLNNLNGVAPADNTFLGSFATFIANNSYEYLVYRTPVGGGPAGAGGITRMGRTPGGQAVPTLGYTNYGGADVTFAPTAIGNLTSNVTLAAGDQSVFALRFDGGSGQLSFADDAQRLNVIDGGLLMGTNGDRTIGDATKHGVITAGPVAGATGVQQLYMHAHGTNVFTNNKFVDNNANAPLAIVKDLDGGLYMQNGSSTFTGGIYLTRGTVEARTAGAFGFGNVITRNGRVNLNQPASINDAGTGYFLATDQAEIYLNSNGTFNGVRDRFVVEGGSTIIGQGNYGDNQGANSLTRVPYVPNTVPSNPGEVMLAPDAIVGIVNMRAGNIDSTTSTIKNLGNNADLYFTNYGEPQPGTTITVGPGTPWKGMSSNRGGTRWRQGEIVANGDFWLQGLFRDNGTSDWNLGQQNDGTRATITNQASGPINAFVKGNVRIDDDQSPNLPGNLTFVVTTGSYFLTNFQGSLGSTNSAATNASVLVQAGGTIDMGRLPNTTTATTMMNGNVTIDGGGRMWLNDENGVGTQSAAGAVWNIKKGGIVQIDHPQALMGNSANKKINVGQFNYEPGAIVRINADNIYGLDRAVSEQPGGAGVIYALMGDRNLTYSNDPVTGFTAPYNLRVANGGGITNDNRDNQPRNGTGFGTVILGNGASLLATNNSVLNLRVPYFVEDNATITIGSSATIDGHQKLGSLYIDQNATGSGGNGAKFVVTAGTSIYLRNSNVIPNTMEVNLPGGVVPILPGAPANNPTNAPDRWIQGYGSLFKFDNETIGALTGNGTVATDNGGTLSVGWGRAASPAGDFTFNGEFAGYAGNFNVNKVGPSKMTLTSPASTAGGAAGTGNTTQGQLGIYGGTFALAGAGAVSFNNVIVTSGSTLLLDNTAQAVDNRLSGSAGVNTGRRLRMLGGDLTLLGNATTAVTENVFELNMDGNAFNRTGGFSHLTVLPAAGGAQTNLVIGNIYQTNDINGASTLVFRGPGLNGTPGTYNADGTYNPGVETTNGRIIVNNPRLVTTLNVQTQTNFNAGLIGGGRGTPFVGTRADLFGSLDPNSQWGDRYVTQDTATSGFRLLADSEYINNIINYSDEQNGGYNARLLTGSTTNLNGSVRVNSLTMQPGATVNIAGGRPQGWTSSRLGVWTGGILVEGGAGGPANINVDAGNQLSGDRFGYNAPYVFHTIGDLNVNGTLANGRGFIKTGPGTLVLGNGPGSLFNSLIPFDENAEITVDAGKVVLNDRLGYERRSNDWYRAHNLTANGGTIDFNGNNQMIDRLQSTNSLPGMGGVVTNTGAMATLNVTPTGNAAFGGHINGNLNFVKSWQDTLVLTSDSNYTGTTTLNNGFLRLQDGGKLTSTSAVNINYGFLQEDNRGVGSMDNRLPNNVDVNLRGGRFELYGDGGSYVKQEFGTAGNHPTKMLAGMSVLHIEPGNGGRADMVFNNLVRSTGATMYFESGGNATLGYPGNLAAYRGTVPSTTYLNDSHIFINNYNGAAPTTVGTALGGWAIVNGDDFAAYLPDRGVGRLSDTGNGFGGYLTNTTPDTWTAAQNVQINVNAATLSGNVKVNLLRLLDPGSDPNYTFADANASLTTAGMLVNYGRNVNVGTTAGVGSLTSNGSEFFAVINQGTTRFNAVVTNNAGGAVALVKHGTGTLQLNTANTYTGGTFVSAGQVTANAVNSIPGDVFVAGYNTGGNGAVVETVAQGVSANSNITLMGGSLFRAFGGAETFKSITLDNDGGRGQNVGQGDQLLAMYGNNGTVTFTSPTAITAIDRNALVRPRVDSSVGTINFTGAYSGAGNGQFHIVNDQAIAEIGLDFQAAIGTVPAGGIVKTGSGLMSLQNATANQFGVAADAVGYTNVFNIKEGVVRVENNNALGNLHAVTTVQSGAVLLGRNVSTNASVTLNGGLLGVTEGSLNLGTVTTDPNNLTVLTVQGNSTIKMGDYFMDNINQGGDIAVFARLRGAGNIDLVGPKQPNAISTFRLGNGITGASNGANDFSGTLTIERGARVLTQTQGGGNFSGSQLGTAKIVMNGGELFLYDDNNNVNNGTLNYTANNVTIAGDSHIQLNRTNGGNNNLVQMGSLTVVGQPQLFVDAGAGYNLSFKRLLGSGNLTKLGGQNWLIGTDADSYAGFTGTITLGGPLGMNVQPVNNSLGLNTSSTNRLSNLVINGSYQPQGSLDIKNSLTVGDNAGQVFNGYAGIKNGAVTGYLSASSASINTPLLKNYGQIGSTNAPATLIVPTITGNGRYQTFNSGVNLIGTFKDDGVKAAGITVSGNNTVGLVTGTTGAGSATGANRIESGTLRLFGGSKVNPIGTGTITVFGSTGSAYSAANKTQAISATTGNLIFDAGPGETISQASAIVNNGGLYVSSGTAVVKSIAGGASRFTPGLLEGLIIQGQNGFGGYDDSTNRPANPGNFGIRSEPRMGQTNLVTGNPVTGWGDNHTWIYTGQVFDADGKFSFIENIDDNTLVSVDGKDVLRTNYAGNRPVSTAYTTAAGGAPFNQATAAGTVDFGMGPENDGWHNIEIRFNNGGGGAGAIAGSGFTNNYGFGFSPLGRAALDGSAYVRPIDPGDGSLFRTLNDKAGFIQVEAGAILTAGQITQTGNLTMTAAEDGATVNIVAPNAATVSNITSVNILGNSGVATIGTGAATTLTVGNVTVPTGVNLVVNSAAPAKVTLNQVTVSDGAVMTVAGPVAHAIKVGNGSDAVAPMTMAATAKINVANNGMILDYAAGNDVANITTVRQLVTKGYNASAALNDGNWAGNGITSSIAQGDGSRAVGYALASEILVNGRTDFMGSTPDLSSVLVRETLAGDATLDGAVDFNDLVQLAQNYNTTVSATTQSWWFNGDFTYDGVVDFNDLVKLAQNYNTALPSEAIPGAPANFESDLAAAFSAVPEPGSLGVVALAGLALLRRRNRR